MCNQVFSLVIYMTFDILRPFVGLKVMVTKKSMEHKDSIGDNHSKADR